VAVLVEAAAVIPEALLVQVAEVLEAPHCWFNALYP